MKLKREILVIVIYFNDNYKGKPKLIVKLTLPEVILLNSIFLNGT